MTLEQIKQKLSDRTLSHVARAIGVHPSYLCIVRSGKRQPSGALVEKLKQYFGSKK